MTPQNTKKTITHNFINIHIHLYSPPPPPSLLTVNTSTKIDYSNEFSEGFKGSNGKYEKNWVFSDLGGGVIEGVSMVKEIFVIDSRGDFEGGVSTMPDLKEVKFVVDSAVLEEVEFVVDSVVIEGKDVCINFEEIEFVVVGGVGIEVVPPQLVRKRLCRNRIGGESWLNPIRKRLWKDVCGGPNPVDRLRNKCRISQQSRRVKQVKERLEFKAAELVRLEEIRLEDEMIASQLQKEAADIRLEEIRVEQEKEEKSVKLLEEQRVPVLQKDRDCHESLRRLEGEIESFQVALSDSNDFFDRLERSHKERIRKAKAKIEIEISYNEKLAQSLSKVPGVNSRIFTDSGNVP